MALLNYSTTVQPGKTVGEIIAMLSTAGANQVLTEYNQGEPTGVSFALDTASGVRQYRLPVDTEAIEKVLRKQRVPKRYQGPEQATRVAWRILKDWIAAQLAIIETQMVAVDQVFLPYMLVGGRTVYDTFLDQQLALGPGADLDRVEPGGS